MPRLEKMTQDEIEDLQKKTNGNSGKRKEIEREYDAFLADYQIGDFGKAYLEDGDSKVNVRNRLRAAAERRDLRIKFLKSKDNTLIKFEIEGPAAPEEPEESKKPRKPKTPSPDAGSEMAQAA